MSIESFEAALAGAQLTNVWFTKLLCEARGDEGDAGDVRDHSPAGVSSSSIDNGHLELDDSDGKVGAKVSEMQRWKLGIERDKDIINIKLTLRAGTAQANFQVETLGHYHLPPNVDDFDDIDIDDTGGPINLALLDFAYKVAYPTLVPYVREAASDLARRVQVRAPSIGYKPSSQMLKALSAAKVDVETSSGLNL